MNYSAVLSQAVEILKKEGCRTIILYGSRAKGNDTERSDIDLAVDCDGDADELKAKLLDIPTLLHFDIVTLSDASQDLKQEITSHGKLLFQKN